MAETKYGKYFFSGVDRPDDGEHGVTLAFVAQDQIKGCYGLIISWLPPRETPYSYHPAHIHTSSEFLVHLPQGDDPFDLGAEVELCMGKETERHTITRPTIAYIPPGFIHSPWTIKKVNRPFIFLQVSHGPHGGREYPQLYPDDADARTRGHKYDKYFFSGPGDRIDDGEHGVTLGVIDDNTFPNCYGIGISWLPHKATPYRFHPPHIHPAAEYLIHLGTNPDDPFDLGAEVELCMGKEMEPHTITRPTAVYIPPGFIHSPWTIKKVDRPFIFVQVSQGPHEGGKYYPQLLPEEKRDIMQYYGHH